MTLLILFFLLSIVFSFLCSIWEAVILSVTPSYVNRCKQEKNPIAGLLQAYKNDIDRPLSAILTLNTIAHTMGAIGVGVEAGKLFGTSEINLGFTTITYESVIAGAMTMAILILSEIIPKTIGANMWRKLTPFTVRSLRVLILILAPFVWLSQRITNSINKNKTRSVLSRADFTAMTLRGAETGALLPDESNIIQNLLRLDKLQVNDIMTPRSVVFTANEKLTLNEFYRNNKPLSHSRIPVYRDDLDHITGMILKDDVLASLAEGNGSKPLSDIALTIPFIENSEPLQRLLDKLIRERKKIAMVNDQYGSIVGLVSMEDVFETLLGFEIVDETDTVEDLQRLARQQWEARNKLQTNPGDHNQNKEN